jgi:hypothetical protein
MTLVEKLRSDWPDREARLEAADRIEALEADHAEFLQTLGEQTNRIVVLEAALREIAAEPLPEEAGVYWDAWKYLTGIARTALEGK